MTSMPISARWPTIAIGLWTAGLLIFSAAPASARVETLRWSHSTPADVEGFRVHYGAVSSSYATTIDVGKPALVDGLFVYNLTIPDTATVYVATTAYGAGFLESDYSNEKLLAGTDPEPPPDPDPNPPPTPGAAWSQNFETSATGTAVPAWRDTGANSSFDENDALFAVSDLAGNRVFSTSSTASNIHSHYEGTGSSDWSHYELRGRMRISAASGGIGVTVYSQFPTADKYYRLRRFHGGTAFKLVAHGTTPTCTQPSTGVVPATDAWFRFRLEVKPVAGGNSIRAKAWADSAIEPPDWQASCTDTSTERPMAGTIGVWAMGAGSKYWDDLEVIPLAAPPTPTAPPPPPVLIQAE